LIGQALTGDASATGRSVLGGDIVVEGGNRARGVWRMRRPYKELGWIAE
jgi:hypothetical protein